MHILKSHVLGSCATHLNEVYIHIPILVSYMMSSPSKKNSAKRDIFLCGSAQHHHPPTDAIVNFVYVFSTCYPRMPARFFCRLCVLFLSCRFRMTNYLYSDDFFLLNTFIDIEMKSLLEKEFNAFLIH